ncbi:MAG: STAS domain-containing protein [Candidatus Competibacteraceae bacterium]
MPIMLITHRSIGAIDIVELEGRLVMADAPEARQQLKSIIEQGQGKLIVDLKGVGFMDSSGLSVLISAYKAMRAPNRATWCCLIFRRRCNPDRTHPVATSLRDFFRRVGCHRPPGMNLLMLGRSTSAVNPSRLTAMGAAVALWSGLAGCGAWETVPESTLDARQAFEVPEKQTATDDLARCVLSAPRNKQFTVWAPAMRFS